MQKFQSVEEAQKVKKADLAFPKFKFCPPILHWVYRFFLNMGADIEYVGLENIPPGPVWLGPNHTSNADNIVVWEAWRRSGRKLADLWAVAGIVASTRKERFFYRTSYPFYYVERRRDLSREIQQAVNSKSLRNVVEGLKAGYSILVYPETTRSRTGALIEPPDPQDKACVGPALLAKVSIITASITGTDKILKPENNDRVLYAIKNIVKGRFLRGISRLPFASELTWIKPTPKVNIRIVVRGPVTIPEKEKGKDYKGEVHSAVMRRIAEPLPEWQRGAYRDEVKDYDASEIEGYSILTNKRSLRGFMFSRWTRSVDLKKLQEQGISVIVFDWDWTLVPFWDKDNLVAGHRIKEARRLGLRIVIVSNSKDPEKKSKISGLTGIPEEDILAHFDNENMRRFKPFRLSRALIKLHIKTDEAILIGNNPLTDGLGAYFAGIRFCWVLRP